jgi:predicted transcriptional regulator
MKYFEGEGFVKLCVFPIEKAEEIVQKYPLSMDVLRKFLTGYMKSRLENEEAISVIDMVLGTVKDFALLTLFSDPRKLYDFFDSNLIWVSVTTGSEIDGFLIRIKQVDQEDIHLPIKIYDHTLSIRANAELTAFEYAFELLENRLKV